MLFQQGFSEINPSGSKMNYLGLSSAESRPQKTSSTKSSSNLQSSGSASNANSSNGVYVDLGKALLEAAKAGDAEKVQECIKNGAPFITDWVSQLLVIFSTSTSAFTFKKHFCSHSLFFLLAHTLLLAMTVIIIAISTFQHDISWVLPPCI
jgi:hypothetical protein